MNDGLDYEDKRVDTAVLPPRILRLANPNKWLDIRRTPDGYTYAHETHCGGQKVAVLIYDEDGDAFARHEWTPCHGDGLQICSITGSVENDDPQYTAVKEVHEEAGIKIGISDLISLGTSRPYKAADAIYHLYAVDATGKEIGAAEGDGTGGEKGSYCKWMPMDKYVQCKDPLVAQMHVRLQARGDENGKS